MLLFQVFVNVGMTVGIMPITGVPLPLMSYRRLVGARHVPGPRPPAVDLRRRRATTAASRRAAAAVIYAMKKIDT